ncbi:uncharacterized protein VTP21DRAFT_1732 [Calcarisporiella thermophila]|uniref:uncharacterized protein n=1 Tax=Calcarisporiella thermophila TaxID=911321 RepID=UPI0037448CEA
MGAYKAKREEEVIISSLFPKTLQFDSGMSTPSDHSIPNIDTASAPHHDSNDPLTSPTQLFHSTMDQLANFGQKLNPLAQRLNRGFGQFRQYAQEKMGTIEDVTELPQDYKELEKRVDALRNIHQGLLRVTRTYTTRSYDYPAQLQESLVEMSRTVGDHLQLLTLSPAERAEFEGAQAHKAQLEKQAPKTLAHALSRACTQGAEQVGAEEPLGAALFKCAAIQEKVGDARLRMDDEITAKFVQPFNTTLNTLLARAMKARRNVQSQRLNLDAIRAKHRSVRPERAEAAQVEIEQAEDQFVAAVEEATTLMKAALDSPEPLRNLSDFVAAQLAYFKEATELLTNLAPELDEIQVTQEAIYRNSRNE